VRMVDLSGDRYTVARRYMLRLRKDDFDDPSETAKLATVLGLSLEAFQERFAYLIENEPAVRPFFAASGRDVA
jgi:ATP-dependent phosphofructokinase / diphosphate-dependent phosphofructokinase